MDYLKHAYKKRKPGEGEKDYKGNYIQSQSDATYVPQKGEWGIGYDSKGKLVTITKPIPPYTYEDYLKDKKDKKDKNNLLKKIKDSYIRRSENFRLTFEDLKKEGKLEPWGAGIIWPKKKDNYIKHHGTEGQKWGVQNGPPYPLENARSMGNKIINRMVLGIKAVDDFLKENKKRKIEEIKLSDNAKIISDNIKLFTTQELRDKIERQRMIKELENNIPTKHESFVKKTITGIRNGLSSKISNAIVDGIMKSINDNKNTYSYAEAKQIAKDFKDGKGKKMSSGELDQLFKIINTTNSIERALG